MVDPSPSEEIERLRNRLQEVCARSELRRILLVEARAFIFETEAERRHAHLRRSVRTEEALGRFKALSSKHRAEQRFWSPNGVIKDFRSILTRFVSQNCKAALRSTQIDDNCSFRRPDLEREILYRAKRRAQGIEGIILEETKPDPKLGVANWRLAGIICGSSDRDDAVAAAKWAARLFADCLISEGDG